MLPDHPAPHIGLALLTLAPYMRTVDIPPEVMQYVKSELALAQNLEAQHPDLADKSDLNSWWLLDALDLYNYYVSATASANQTETAVAILTPSDTPVPSPTLSSTITPYPPASPLPSSPSSTITAVMHPDNVVGGTRLEIIIVAAFVAIILIIVIYIIRKSAKKNS